MRYLSFCLIAFPLFLPAQTPEPTIRTTTSEVLLDFVVRDKNAKIVRDLRPDEVQVLEDGVPQSLRHFEFYDGHSQATRLPENAPAPAPTASQTAAAPAVIAPPGPKTVNELRDLSVVSVVVADLDPRARKLTVDAMNDFVKNELRPNTYVGVFGLGLSGLRFIQPYTNDGAQISAAVQRAASDAMYMALKRGNQPGVFAEIGATSSESEGPGVVVTGSNAAAGSTAEVAALASSRSRSGSASGAAGAAAIKEMLEDQFWAGLAAKLPAGQYEAEVSFQYKGEKLSKEVKFTLAGAS
jgi:VWFA-related protein